MHSSLLDVETVFAFRGLGRAAKAVIRARGIAFDDQQDETIGHHRGSAVAAGSRDELQWPSHVLWCRLAMVKSKLAADFCAGGNMLVEELLQRLFGLA